MKQNRTRIAVNCHGCGKPFMAVEYETRRGKGKYCSRRCLCLKVTPNRFAVKECNGNWKGGLDVKNAKYYAKYPEKLVAHMAVKKAIRNGLLTRHPCEICGAKESQAHHEDYSKPLDVNWLCSKHHHAAHKAIKPGPLEI